jgi:hypothetical protein
MFVLVKEGLTETPLSQEGLAAFGVAAAISAEGDAEGKVRTAHGQGTMS